MDKQNAVNAYNGILCSFKRKEILIHVTKWVNLEDSKLNNLVAKGQILYDPTRVRYLTVVKYIEAESGIVIARR